MRNSKKKRIISAILKSLPRFLQIKYLEYLYKRNIGHKLNWSNLQTYTEKIQWAKIYDATQVKTDLSDKFLVRKWVEKKIGAEYLIPLYGVWDNFDKIDFKKLPNQFVLKTNHGSGTVYVVKDKDIIDYNLCRQLFNDWMNTDYAYVYGMELQYSKIKRKIIAEQFIETETGEIPDYKFLCFDGKPYFCWVDLDRFSNHTRNVYNLNWELQTWNQHTYGNSSNILTKPQNFDKMIEIATILCQGFSHVRVDLYNIEGKIYFGEMTFTNGSGFDRIVPEKYDYKLGKLWNIAQ